MRIDRATAEELLAEDAQEVADKIAAAAQVPLTDGQFGALTSFAFNLGWGALRGSTLWRLVQAGDMRGAAGQFGRWTKAGRPLRVLPGLVKRRAAERALFAGA
jgi:lysozyme